MAAIELATAYVSIVPETSRIAPATQQAFGTVQNQATQAGRQMGDRLGDGIKKGIAAAGAVAAAGLAAGISGALERERINDKLAASLGLDAGLAKEYGETTAKLYSQGFGESMSNVSESVGAVASAFKNLGYDGEATLEQVTGRAMNFASVFGTEVGETVQTTKQLIVNGFAKDSTQAFDMLTAAFQQIPIAMRAELPEILNEYGMNFKALGFSGEQSFNLLIAAADKGKFVLDKTGDALKEFTIRGSDMSKTSVEAYQAIGLNAADASSKIASGGAGAQEVLQATARGLLGITDPAERANTAIALFGTPLEDLSVDQIPAFLEAISNGTNFMGGFEGAADRMGETLAGNTSSSLEVLKRQLESGIVAALEKGAHWVTENKTAAISFAAVLGTVAAAIGVVKIATVAWNAAQAIGAAATKTWTAVQWLWNAAMTANPIGIVVVAIAGLVAAIALAWNHSETFRNVVMSAWEGIKTAVGAAWDFIKPVFEAIGNWITGTLAPAFMGFWHDVVEPVFNNVGVIISAAWNGIIKPIFEGWKAFFENVLFPVIRFLWDNVVKPTFDGIGTAISFAWNNLIKPAFDGIKAGIGAVGDAFGAAGRLIGGAWDGVLGIIRPVAHAIGRILSGIPDKIGPWEIPGASTVRGFGGKLEAFRTGGQVRGPGSGTSDSILAWLSNGEFVVNADAAAKHLPLLAAINSGRNLIERGDYDGVLSRFGVEEDDPFVRGALGVRSLIKDLDFTGNLASLGIEEDSPLVDLGLNLGRFLKQLPGFAAGGLVQTSDSISGVQQAMWDALRTAFPDAVLTSATRTADVGSGYDYHMQAKAIDIAGPNMPAMAEWIAKNYPGSLELIHANGFSHNIKNGENVGDGYSFYGAGTMAGHADHVHWAMSSAPSIPVVEPDSGASSLPPAGGGASSGGSPSISTGGGAAGGGTSGGGGSGASSTTSTSGTPVFVTNWPAGVNVTEANGTASSSAEPPSAAPPTAASPAAPAVGGDRVATAASDFAKANIDGLLSDLGLSTSGGAIQELVSALRDAVARETAEQMKRSRTNATAFIGR